MFPTVELFKSPILAFCALLVIYRDIARVRAYRYCVRHGTELEGTIIGYQTTGRRRSYSRRTVVYSPVFEFWYEGATRRKVALQNFASDFLEARLSGEMQIYYCDAYPDFVVVKGHSPYMRAAILSLLFAYLLFPSVGMMLSFPFPYSLLSFAILAAMLLISLICVCVRRHKRKSE